MPTINHKGVKTVNRKPEIKTNRADYAKYYNSQLWKKTRDWYYKIHPLCEVCEAHGRINPTEHIHHKFNFMNGKTEDLKWKLLGDTNNLIAVCTCCHAAIHHKIDRQGLVYGCDELTDEEYNKAHNYGIYLQS